MTEDADRADMTDAARRGLQRAGIHLVKAALEVVAALNAFLEEVQGVRSTEGDGGPEDVDQGSGGPQRIVVE